MQTVFGTYRFFLCTLVAYSHIGDFHHMAGTYAVFAFFILSGFLMTMVLEQVYLQRAGGVGDYLLNRFLRIYPLYWFAIALAALVATSGPLSLWKEIMMPHNFKEVLYNIIILAPMPKSSNDYCLLSVTWSLRAEIFFYLMLPVLLQWRRGYYTWLMVSAALLLFYIFGPLKFYQRYFTFWGAWPAFAAGSALFHFRHKLPRMPHAMGLGLMAVTVTLMCFNKPLLPQPKGAGFYLLLGLNILVVHYLSRLDVGRWRKLDAWLGELAYSVFLLHLPVAELVRRVVPAGVPSYSKVFYMYAMLGIFVASVALWRFVEHPMQRWRQEIRNRPGRAAALQPDSAATP